MEKSLIMAVFKGANHIGKKEKNICPIESHWFLITMQLSRLKQNLFLTWLSPKPFFLEIRVFWNQADTIHFLMEEQAIKSFSEFSQ